MSLDNNQEAARGGPGLAKWQVQMAMRVAQVAKFSGVYQFTIQMDEAGDGRVTHVAYVPPDEAPRSDSNGSKSED